MKASDFFTFPQSLAPFAAHFPGDVAPWEWLKQIGTALKSWKFEPLAIAVPPGVHISGDVYIHPSVKLPHTATIQGPAWIGANTELRPGVFIRGQVIVGEGCVLGNSCEFKNALVMDRAEVPHFNYVGDTIIGNKGHLAAGVICSNLRLDRKNIRLRLADGTRVDTGLRKFGAIVGDAAEVGCNAVLQPGTILGRRALVHPVTAFGGILPEGMVAGPKNAELLIRPRFD